MIHEAVQETLMVVGIVSGVPLLAATAVGLVVAVFQAATQVQEQSVPYVAKLITVVLCAVIGGSTTLALIVEFMQRMLASIAHLGSYG